MHDNMSNENSAFQLCTIKYYNYSPTRIAGSIKFYNMFRKISQIQKKLISILLDNTALFSVNSMHITVNGEC